MTAAVRILGAALCFSGIAVAAVYLAQERWVDVAVLMLVGLGQVLCFLLLRTGWARGVCSLVLLTAGVSAAQLLYERIAYWDLAIHFLATGVLALLWRALRLRRRPARSQGPSAQRPALEAAGTRRRVAASALVGLILALVWEAMELVGFLLVSPEIHIPPADTASDVVVGVLGAALVGLLRPPPRAPGGRPAEARGSTAHAERRD